jgi:hypothetical protein
MRRIHELIKLMLFIKDNNGTACTIFGFTKYVPAIFQILIRLLGTGCIANTKMSQVISKYWYSLRSILLFANTDVSTTKICLDTSILAKSIMDRREYIYLVHPVPGRCLTK